MHRGMAPTSRPEFFPKEPAGSIAIRDFSREPMLRPVLEHFFVLPQIGSGGCLVREPPCENDCPGVAIYQRRCHDVGLEPIPNLDSEIQINYPHPRYSPRWCSI